MTQIYYATRSGGKTLDAGEGGGNPFATALIELADEPALRLRDLATRLRRLTDEKSRGYQIVECVGSAGRPDWRFQSDPSAGVERRQALVLVVSDYSSSNLRMLMGAARDERRISAMLAKHGFCVTQSVEPRRQAVVAALRSFKRRSQQADVSVIYATGHGMEVDGEVFLLPGDYPVQRGFRGPDLRRYAVRVAKMAEAASAHEVNTVFFAACRTQGPP